MPRGNGVLITSAFGGRPGMISGATGSLAVVMVALVVTHGAEYLFATVVLMGILQMLFAVAKLGKLIRMVPHPVMLGFVNGLSIVIFMAQFGHFKTMGATARRASACTCVISARIAWNGWKKAGDLVEVNVLEDPHYHIADNKFE